MKLLEKFFNWLRPDGVKHFIVSCFAFLLLAPCMPSVWLLWIPVLIVAIIGVAKEFYDAQHEGHCAEWHDVACDLVGIAAGLVLYLWILGIHSIF